MVSGGPLLAEAVAAEYRVPAESGMLAPHRIIAAGDRIDLGDNWRIRAIATPGHTPHHTSYFVDGGNGSGVALTGGSMLVGAVGRADLLGSELTLELTRAQYRSVRGLAGTLDGDVVVAPTHGAGSFCAASPTTAAISTIDGEWTHNPALIEESEDRFVPIKSPASGCTQPTTARWHPSTASAPDRHLCRTSRSHRRPTSKRRHS